LISEREARDRGLNLPISVFNQSKKLTMQSPQAPQPTRVDIPIAQPLIPSKNVTEWVSNQSLELKVSCNK